MLFVAGKTNVLDKGYTAEQVELKRQKETKARDIAIRIQREFLATNESKRVLFPKDTPGRYAALNRTLHAILVENLKECEKDERVQPLWEGNKCFKNPYRHQLLELADAKCFVRPRGENKRVAPEEVDVDLTDEEHQVNNATKKPRSEAAATKRAAKRTSAQWKRQQIEALVAQETSLRQQQGLLRKGIKQHVQGNDTVKAAEVTAKLSTVEGQLRGVVASLQKYRLEEEKSVKKSLNARAKGVTLWKEANEGMQDVIDDQTDWEATSGAHFSHVLPEDTLLCAQLRAALAEIRNQPDNDIVHCCKISSDTFVGQMPLTPNDYLRARKAFCANLQHKPGQKCLCQKDIAIVTAVLQADEPYTMKGLMSKVGIDPYTNSTSHFQQRLAAMPLWCFMPAPKDENHVSHWLVMAKDAGMDYAKHSELLRSMGSRIRRDFTVKRADRSMVSKEDLKAFKLMCSTKQDGRILEAAMLRNLSNRQIRKHYGRNFAKVRQETREALAVVKSLMRTTDILLEQHNKGGETDGQKMVSLLERDFGSSDETVAACFEKVTHLLDNGDEEGELEAGEHTATPSFFDKLLSEMQDKAEGDTQVNENELVEAAVAKMLTQLGQQDFEPISDDGEEEEDAADEEMIMLQDVETVLASEKTDSARFKGFEKTVNAELEKLAQELGGQEMDRVDKLVDVFEMLSTQEMQEEEEEVFAGDDDEDEHYHMDAVDMARMYDTLNVPELVAARKVQHKRALKRRLQQKCIGLMFRKGWRPCNVQKNIEKYPDLHEKLAEVLRVQGHGANKWRNSSEQFTIHKSNAKGSGYRAAHRGLLADGYKIGYSSMTHLGHHNRKCKTEKKKYQEVVSMRLRKMVKRFMEDNIDRKYQIAQYEQFNTILATLKEAEGEQDVLIAERDDHAIKRAGTGVGSNQKAVLTEHDSEVWEATHDYADALMTKLQATATFYHGLGSIEDMAVTEKQVVYTKALQLTPSSPHQLMHDLYRQVEDPELRDIFYNSDGHIKRVQHWRVDGGGNEAINSLLNRILWTEYMERCSVDVLLVSHCESGGNIRELVERMQSTITQAQQGHFFPFDAGKFADAVTGQLDPDVIEGYHIANNEKYKSVIDGAMGLHNQKLMAKESNRLVDNTTCPKCPRHFWKRAPFFYNYFHSSNAKSTVKREALVDALPDDEKHFAKEAQHLETLLRRHSKFGLSRYTFFLSRCPGGDVSCPSVKCCSAEPWMCPERWCEPGPPTYSSGVIFPQYDPEREGSYMKPHVLWENHNRGMFRNQLDAFLPSKVLMERWKTLTGGNKGKALSMAEATSVAAKIPDNYITPQRVFDFFRKQRLIHLRRTAGLAKRRQTQKDNDTAVPLGSRTRVSRPTGTAATSSNSRRKMIVLDAPEAEEEEEEEDAVEEVEQPTDPDWPYSIEKAEEIFKVRHFPILQEAANELPELLHTTGQKAGKFNKGKMTQRVVMVKFDTEGWWAGHISSLSNKNGNGACQVNIKFRQDPSATVHQMNLTPHSYGQKFVFAVDL